MSTVSNHCAFSFENFMTEENKDVVVAPVAPAVEENNSEENVNEDAELDMIAQSQAEADHAETEGLYLALTTIKYGGKLYTKGALIVVEEKHVEAMLKGGLIVLSA